MGVMKPVRVLLLTSSALIAAACVGGPTEKWAYAGSMSSNWPSACPEEKHLVVGVPTGDLDFNWHGPGFYRHADHYEINYCKDPSGEVHSLRVWRYTNATPSPIELSAASTVAVKECSATISLVQIDGSPVPANGTYDMSRFKCAGP